jgi:hypothetical protein
MAEHHHPELIEAIDRHGSDLAAWPDQVLANEARRAALADRDFRARLDGAAALAAGLASLGAAMDADIAASGAASRVEAGVLAALPRRRNGRRWALVAAAVVAAAALGAIVDVTILAPAGSEPIEVVILDPLVFGPALTGAP